MPMDCYEDMFKEITRKLYGTEDGLSTTASANNPSITARSVDSIMRAVRSLVSLNRRGDLIRGLVRRLRWIPGQFDRIPRRVPPCSWFQLRNLAPIRELRVAA